MEVGVLLASLLSVFITSLLISALGTEVFFSLLGISVVLGVALLYTGNAETVIKRLSASR